MDFKDIIYEKKEGVAWITINRLKKLNAASFLEQRKPDYSRFKKQ